VPRTPISDLLEALKALKSLQETVRKHDEVLSRILDRLDQIDQRPVVRKKARRS
jgi:hypothetical protein